MYSVLFRYVNGDGEVYENLTFGGDMSHVALIVEQNVPKAGYMLSEVHIKRMVE